MRLPEAKIKEALLHPEQLARQAALSYFSLTFSLDTEVMPVAIQAIEKYGREEAFPFHHVLTNLAQTEATVTWVVNELTSGAGGETYQSNLARLLTGVDPRLLTPHREALLQVPAFVRFHEVDLDQFLDLQHWDAARCWQELEEISAEAAKERGEDEDDYEVPSDHVSRVIRALARQATAADSARVLELLGQKVTEFENNPMLWLEPFAVELAGEMRLQAAIPFVVEKLRAEEADILWEESVEALKKIGGPAVIRGTFGGFQEESREFRFFSAELLGDVHCDEAVQRCLELLPLESELDVQTQMAAALMAQFAFEGIEPVRQLILSGKYDKMLMDLRRDLVQAALVMDVSFPDLKRLKEKVEKDQADLRRRMKEAEIDDESELPLAPEYPVSWNERPVEDRLPVKHPILNVEQKVGRNDPCPCGSGKKFKKCCMNK